jgi:hypothetical protein
MRSLLVVTWRNAKRDPIGPVVLNPQRHPTGLTDADTMGPPIWCARDDAAYLKSQSRKQTMQHWHLPEYWRMHAFPQQCRPIGNSGFECR